jgi:23S rRNA pseudouridine1911/1915/1917 synthase
MSDVDLDSDDIFDISFYNVEEAQDGMRIDKALGMMQSDLSRSRVEVLIEQGQVRLNGEVCTQTSRKLKTGDHIGIEVPPPVEADPQPENIPLDIVYEDEHLLVINKQAGLVVHPGAGNRTGTLVNALLYHCGAELSGIGGVVRPGIVHRLDKDTSGLMVAAKSDAAHKGLAAQLEDRSLSRVYKALVFKTPFPAKGKVDQPIGRHTTHRLKMAINKKNGREARTYYTVEENFSDALSLVSCKLETGRTHQIRVHMEFLKHPLIGDPFYGPQPNAVRSALKNAGYADSVGDAAVNFPRQALHAAAISFIHPISEEGMGFEAPLPADISKLLKLLKK